MAIFIKIHRPDCAQKAFLVAQKCPPKRALFEVTSAEQEFF